MAFPAEIAPSPGYPPQGQRPDASWPQDLGLTQQHIEEISTWQEQVFPGGEPLSRQGGQFRRELAEVGDEVFGLTSDQLSQLPVGAKLRIGAEITDVVISGVGLIKVLGFNYEKLRHRREMAIYNPEEVTKLERWQIDANGGDAPVKERLSEFGSAALKAHRGYDDLGTEEISELTDAQKEKLAKDVAIVMDNGLSVLNGIGVSFDAMFRAAYRVMKEKYDPVLIDALRSSGLTDSQAIAEAKRRHKLKTDENNTTGNGDIVLFVAP